MDDKAQIHVYEAVTVVVLIIAAVYFITTFYSEPTVSYSTLLSQLQSTGEDSLRIADEEGFLTSSAMDGLNNGEIDQNNQLVQFLDKVIPGVSYKIFVDKKCYYESDSASANSTVNAHRLIIEQDGTIHDVQLIMWFSYLQRRN